MTTWTNEELSRIGEAEELEPAIDAAYDAKYERYGPRIVSSAVSPQAEPVTIRLVPRAK